MPTTDKTPWPIMQTYPMIQVRLKAVALACSCWVAVEVDSYLKALKGANPLDLVAHEHLPCN